MTKQNLPVISNVNCSIWIFKHKNDPVKIFTYHFCRISCYMKSIVAIIILKFTPGKCRRHYLVIQKPTERRPCNWKIKCVKINFTSNPFIKDPQSKISQMLISCMVKHLMEGNLLWPSNQLAQHHSKLDQKFIRA